MIRLARICTLTSLAMSVVATAASGQLIVQVVDGPTGNALPLAAVQTLNADGRVIETQSTDTDGRAVLQNQPAVRGIKVTALGYHPSETEVQGNRAYGPRPFNVSMTPSAFELDEVTVEVDATNALPGRLQFTQRREERTGIFLDPFDVGLKSEYGVVQIFTELEGVRRTGFGGARMAPSIVTNLGTGCVRYRINNSRVPDANWNLPPLSSLLPQDVMAVEIYRYFGEVPRHMQKDAFPPEANQPCGLVVSWPKEVW